MAKIKSLEELMKIKENAMKGLKMRDSGKKGKIIVAMGTCGIAAGAKDTLRAIVDSLDEKGIEDVAVVQSGCFGLCDVEPTIEVHLEGADPIIYGHVTPAQAKRIIDQHIVEGKVVGDLIVKKGEL
ncbi:MAG TPA: (2Fe-2S) ferredoxin domain-containing protein [Mesotoga sp.]|mgnify:CR=1 FL=1|jgi:NADP-reducing hydrogenase subunit HndB|uniref:NADP-reducing hydrogenase, subunit B n=1 Tax=Mesotoga infera TaxID=1236046 RepID=A0A7Z7LHF5_9BACT|nr:(2Fe-2S) ferredoxin domain-containing protein [Mesotoga infera]MBP7200152.1 (2Fe-2S) ferredoxin domain-containing protein [Mesotoga sp.]MDI9375878.1 (2Fe-2S) ferredoxin domain-containing protein [Thermotogota bacterium]NLI07293.1 (2Fe-2S) ferredoxin domain-containing protein [Thermotogaceae bacterium]MBP8660138.1 (2Fe-2S) ferredoxin domain-containing protein [Mesotoga sp.]MDD4039670.1 (2Fe-2S) ferredoxin domain-containing protein [Mesotoga sp.]